MPRDVRTAGLHWLLQRITAMLLGVGLLVHFFVLHFTIDRPVTFDKVHERLQQPGWVAFDIVLLACALYHALNGLRGVVIDYAPSDATRRALSWVVWIVGCGAFVFGVMALVPFGR